MFCEFYSKVKNIIPIIFTLGKIVFRLSKYHKILGVSDNASPLEIKKAYRQLAFKYHPDINPEYEDRFKEILHAYQKLISENTSENKSHEQKVFVRRYNKWISKEEYEEKINQAKAYAKSKLIDDKEQAIKDFEELKETNTFKSFKSIAILSILLSSLLLLDYYLPLKKTDYKVVNITKDSAIHEDALRQIKLEVFTTYIVLENNKGKELALTFDRDLSKVLEKGNQTKIYQSNVFGVTKVMEIEGDFTFNTAWYSFHKINIVLAIFYLMVVFLCSISVGPTPYFYILIYLSVWGIPITFVSYLLFVLFV